MQKVAPAVSAQKQSPDGPMNSVVAQIEAVMWSERADEWSSDPECCCARKREQYVRSMNDIHYLESGSFDEFKMSLSLMNYRI